MTDLGIFLDFHSVRFERLLPGPIERVWDYLTKPEYMKTWLAVAKVDFRVGGTVELTFDLHEVPQRKQAGCAVRGVVSRYEPPRVLAYSWVDKTPGVVTEGTGPDSIVTFELEPRGENVLLILTHRQLPAEKMPSFAAGWHTHLQVLHDRLKANEPELFLVIYDRMLAVYKQEAAKRQAGSANA